MAANNIRKNLYGIFVGNLPWTVADLELKAYFSQFGYITESIVIYNRETGLSKNYGFVYPADETTYWSIFRKPVHKIDGHFLTVSKANNATAN